MNRMPRRRMLLAISQLVLGATLAGCGGAEPPAAPASAVTESELALLASVAYDLFPFPELTPELYIRVGERLLEGRNAALDEGLLQLRTAAGNTPWRDLDEARRLAVLTQLQSSPFFAQLRAVTVEVLYRAPETFAMINYGGSAIEYGGYLHRGFDDIDWLPAAP